MKTDLIETGRIVNTHGIRGELRLQPWADSPQSLCDVPCLYIDGEPLKVNYAKIHKAGLIISFDGIDSIDAAIKLKNKTVSVRREDITLKEGTYFIADLIGLKAINAETGETIGAVKDILTLPANNVYVIESADGSAREILIPAVSEFIKETNLEEGYVKLSLIEGM